MKTKFTQREKTVVQAVATKQAAKKTSKFILLLMVAVIVPATFLSSVFFPASPASLDQIKTERRELKAEISLLKDSIVSVAGNASRQNIVNLKYELQNRIQESEALEIIYQPLKESKYVSGFPSLHKFLWNFGIGLIMFALSAYLIISVNALKGYKRKAANVASMMSMTASGFYMAWIFFPEDDLPLKSYFTVLFAIGILSAISAYWINKIQFQSRHHLKVTIRSLFTYIYKEIDINDFKNTETGEKHRKRRVELVNDAIGHD